MVLVLYADRDQPFRSPWREEFLGNLSHLLNAIPVVQEVEELSTGDVKRMGLPAPGNHQL